MLFARSDDTVAPVAFDLAALVLDQRAVLNHLLPDDVVLEIDTGDGAVPVEGNPVALRRLVQHTTQQLPHHGIRFARRRLLLYLGIASGPGLLRLGTSALLAAGGS